jgi:Family of unknown function (DUF5343)
MAIEPNGAAPYAPAQTVIELIDGYRNRGFATPFTSDVLVRAGVPDSLVNRTLQALRLLDLIGDDGRPTEQFDALKQARGDEEFKARLNSWLLSVYADVLQYTNPVTDTPDRVTEAFRGYKPEGQRSRMVILMLGLFAFAGIIDDPPKRAAPKQKSGSSPSGPPRQTAIHKRSTSASPIRRGRESSIHETDGLPPSITGLLRDLPKDGNAWSSDRREAWLETFKVVLNYAFPIDDSHGSSGMEAEEV